MITPERAFSIITMSMNKTCWRLQFNLQPSVGNSDMYLTISEQRLKAVTEKGIVIGSPMKTIAVTVSGASLFESKAQAIETAIEQMKIALETEKAKWNMEIPQS